MCGSTLHSAFCSPFSQFITFITVTPTRERERERERGSVCNIDNNDKLIITYQNLSFHSVFPLYRSHLREKGVRKCGNCLSSISYSYLICHMI